MREQRKEAENENKNGRRSVRQISKENETQCETRKWEIREENHERKGRLKKIRKLTQTKVKNIK